jgi:hypothetical protein
MTASFAEITFVVEREDPASIPPLPRLVCARCRSDVQHNVTLHTSFCSIHGFAADLAEIRPTGYARTRGVPG